MKVKLALALCLVGTAAVADPIDNPGNFFWGTGTGDISFANGSTITRSIPASSGSLDTDLDSSGNITFNSFTIGSVFVNPYTVEVLVTAGSSSGTLDASVSGYYNWSLALRIKITGNSVGPQCVTPSFTREFEAAYTYSAGTHDGELRIYSGDGGSGGNDGWLDVPAITAACNGQANTINTLFKFGGTGGSGLKIERLGAFTNPGPTGS